MNMKNLKLSSFRDNINKDLGTQSPTILTWHSQEVPNLTVIQLLIGYIKWFCQSEVVMFIKSGIGQRTFYKKVGVYRRGS